MAVVTLGEVQQWLERTKANLEVMDTQLEETARLMTFAELSQLYDTTVWTDQNSTPSLVSKIISARVAAWYFLRVYSEEDSSPEYGNYLLSLADNLSKAIASGTMDLVDVPGLPSSSDPATFYPDENTGRVQQYDDAGSPIGGMHSSAAKFTMGARF